MDEESGAFGKDVGKEQRELMKAFLTPDFSVSEPYANENDPLSKETLKRLEAVSAFMRSDRAKSLNVPELKEALVDLDHVGEYLASSKSNISPSHISENNLVRRYLAVSRKEIEERIVRIQKFSVEK